ncbi:ATP-binding protein [Spirillospora sp. NPDC029432]|uniref:ATP-binding protein n=1 Tax=Spirillospora sp. NPDC029432 TaxID=3154599 RepID=UPI0034555C2D
MKFSLALPREALSIPVIRRVLGDALRALGVSEDCVGDILVAASEACTNVIQHARASGDFEVTGSVDDGACRLRIEDGGRGPRKAPPLTEPDDLAESGRGIRIMRALVDELSIDSAPEHGTVVHLHKRLTWRDEALIRRLDGRLMHSAG